MSANQRKSLFPIVSGGEIDKRCQIVDNDNAKSQGSLSWLKNDSFKQTSDLNVKSAAECGLTSTSPQHATVPAAYTYTDSSSDVESIQEEETKQISNAKLIDYGFADDINVDYTRRERHSTSIVTEKEYATGSRTRKKRKHSKHKRIRNSSESSMCSEDSSSDDEKQSKRNAKKRKNASRDRDKSHHKKKKKEQKHKKKTREKSGERFRKKLKKDLKRERDMDMPKHHHSKLFFEDIADLEPRNAFRFDRLADSNNLAYGSIYQMHIAKRNLLTKVCLVPSNMGRPIYIDERKSKFSANKTRYFSKEVAKQIKQKPIVDISHHCDSKMASQKMAANPKPEVHLKNEHDEFIPVSGDLDLEIEQENEENQRPVDTMGFDAIRDKVEYYNKTLRKNPDDIATWLEWIEFQPKYIEFHSIQRNVEQVEERKPLQKSTLDVQLSIVDKAVEKNPKSMDLLLKRLEIGRELWEPDMLIKEWKSLLFQYPNNVELWKKYLLFRQSHHYTFSVSTCLKAYVKCIETLRSIVEGSMTSHQALPNTEYQLIGIFADMCQLLWQAGHTEKAIASYQALLEFNLNCPAVLAQASHSDKMEFLEAFWGSSAPHIGENHAMGWHAWVNSKGEVARPHAPWSTKASDEEFEEQLIQQHASDHISLIWQRLESTRLQRQWLPWRPNLEQGETDEDCEDPDRLVLSDDVTSCLFTLTSDAQRFDLICRFLRMLGVQVHTVLLSDAYQKRDIGVHDLKAYGDIAIVEKVSSDGTNKLDHRSTFVCNVIDQIVPGIPEPYKTLLLKIAVTYRCSLLKSCDKQFVKKEGKALKKWLKSILKQEEHRNNLFLWEELANVEWQLGNHDDALHVMYTAISMNQSELSKKQAHEFTFQDLSTIRLYLNFVMKCLIRGSDAVAANKLNACKRCENLLYLLAVGETIPTFDELTKSNLSPTNRLRAKHAFMNLQTKLETHSKAELQTTDTDCILLWSYSNVRLCWTLCHAYFQYCADSYASAAEVLTSAINLMTSSKEAMTSSTKMLASSIERCQPIHTKQQEITLDKLNYFEHIYDRKQLETLLEYRVDLAQFHFEANPVLFKTLREPLLQALDFFPANSRFLNMYIRLEAKAGLSRDLRSYFHRKCNHVTSNHVTSTTLWWFAVLAELVRKKRLEEAMENYGGSTDTRIAPDSGISHQIRAWLERGTSDYQAKYSALLWRLYILFEADQGNLSQAEAIAYRAIQVCPASKELYMDLIRLFPRKLSDTLDILSEKELRLRSPYEEVELLTKASGFQKQEETKDADNVETMSQ